MAEGGKEPEESVWYTFVCDDDEQGMVFSGEADGAHPSLQASFSFRDGEELQKRVQRLEKELENVSTMLNLQQSRSKDDANEETKLRRKEEARVGELITEIDALRKELKLKEDDRQCLQDQFNRAVRNAEEERARLKNHYEGQIALLKEKYEGEANVPQSRLLDQLDSQVRTLERSFEDNNSNEMQFNVRQVPNNDAPQPSQPDLICYSCNDSYHPNDLEETCLFHPLPPMKKSKWEKDWIPGLDPKKYQRYSYWACCNTLAKTRPRGCCRGRHHQKWECDILLKKAMLVDKSNTDMMLERCSGEVIIISRESCH